MGSQTFRSLSLSFSCSSKFKLSEVGTIAPCLLILLSQRTRDIAGDWMEFPRGSGVVGISNARCFLHCLFFHAGLPLVEFVCILSVKTVLPSSHMRCWGSNQVLSHIHMCSINLADPSPFTKDFSSRWPRCHVKRVQQITSFSPMLMKILPPKGPMS